MCGCDLERLAGGSSRPAEARHVLVSNSASKAILRAAADEVVRSRANIAYFPSYDLVTAAPNAARFYGDDTRRINSFGAADPHNENVLRSFHRRVKLIRKTLSRPSNSTSPPRPRPTPGSSATKRRSKPPETRAIVRADADLYPKRKQLMIIGSLTLAAAGGFTGAAFIVILSNGP